MSGKINPTIRRLAASIVKFLQDSQNNGTLESDDAESMEVATGIISESFGLDATPVTDPVNLLQVFDVYEKTREKMVDSLHHSNMLTRQETRFVRPAGKQHRRSRTIKGIGKRRCGT